jgi:hypothetical protein
MNPSQASYATERARLMFGCYRKGDANDADTYVAAVSAVLTGYSPSVIHRVTDPRSGLPRRYSFMPTVKEVVDECEAEEKRLDAIKRLGARHPMPRLAGPQFHRANVFVPITAPQYNDMVEKSKTGDPNEWRMDDKRPGIWVVFDWINVKPPNNFKGLGRP